jgi:hypothetical protein
VQISHGGSQDLSHAGAPSSVSPCARTKRSLPTLLDYGERGQLAGVGDDGDTVVERQEGDVMSFSGNDGG